MENCLKDYVGLQHCSKDNPKSGLWINDLPGISTELVQAVTPKEVDSFLGLWDRMNSRAWQRIQADVSRFMQTEKKVNLSTVAYQTQRLRLQKPVSWLGPSTLYQGVYIQAPFARYGKITVNGLQFYAQEAGITTVVVLDAVTGKELLNLPAQTVVAGSNRIEINTEFGLSHDRLQLFVGIDATGLIVQANDSQAYEWYNYGSQWGVGPCCECWDGGWNDDYFEMRPASFDSVMGFAATINRFSIGNGVSLDAELGCGVDTFLCENKRHFAAAWQHLLAAELMKEKRGSYKLNFFAQTLLERTAELEESFMADYEKYAKLAIQRIPVDGGGMCFNCEGVTGFTYDSLV